ncbi:MAG: ATP-dependent protease ATPase subunit HslU [Deltaproteobacteria bacterium]|nr:ATP-dependent protease ATPase subunit HslU [Deltaproteobacteria bacterium]
MSENESGQNQESIKNLSPREIVQELDRFIIGQKDAKRAVAIALRNRWRRLRVEGDMREEITPKNIIMIGPTGVGKTEIARRLAKLAEAPFYKVEASKFTEVGYVGKDVESMVRDLVEIAVNMVREQERERVKKKAEELAEERLLDILLPPKKETAKPLSFEENAEDKTPAAPADESASKTREKMRQMLRDGKLDDRKVELDPPSAQGPTPNFGGGMPMVEIISAGGTMDDLSNNLKDMFGNMFPSKDKKRKYTVPEALKVLASDEANKLLDMESITKQAVKLAENNGIIFLDEIDKIAGNSESRGGPDVSREGVQRDILPIVEGSTVSTKYGFVKTNHVLFIASGAFHVTKPSDLIPELQGRFPIRVELHSLKKEEFLRILKEPQNSLLKQYSALMNTENVTLDFKDDAVEAMADLAAQANDQMENIGARRLHTILEKVMDDISFEASEKRGETFHIDAAYIQERLADVIKNQDLSQYIL